MLVEQRGELRATHPEGDPTPVPVYVSLLRAVNVGGRKLPMADLRALYEHHGHRDVVTYVQSGNVVSRAATRSPATVAREIGDAIEAELGLDVDVLVRTPAELRRVLAANPFLRGRGARPDPKTLHVTFLAVAPAATRVADLDGRPFAPDEFRLAGREVYLSCPKGYGTTKINNAWFERKLGVAATTRNWRTVGKLVELASG
jgi:uncharacterized protein (DUF1697 family)